MPDAKYKLTTLTVSQQVHDQVAEEADKEGKKIGRFTEQLLLSALAYRKYAQRVTPEGGDIRDKVMS